LINSYDSCLVRIRNRKENGLVVGAGFLFDGEQHIFTCAHVVTASLGLFEDTPDAPHDLISLDFPLIAPKKLLTAKVVYWQPRQEDESGDIAVLQLQDDLPEEAESPRFAQAEDFLPLLQFTLHQLFLRRSGHRLTLQAYHEIGGVKGALLQHAEKTYMDLSSDEHRKLARALFLRLIEPGATEQDTTRRRAALAEFDLDNVHEKHVMSETIDGFVKARLLTTKARLSTTNTMEGPQTIEVSHEILIREWGRLATWVREARDEDIPLQRSVTKDMEEWERRGKARDRLYRGTQLKDAQAWAGRNLVSEKERAFLHAGAVQGMWRMTMTLVIGLLLVSTIGFAGISLLQRNIVTNTNDDGPGLLRDVVATASSGSTISFSPFLRNQSITLKTDISITKNLTINGPGVDNLTIIEDHGGLLIESEATVSILDLSFQNGTGPRIVNILTNVNGALRLTRCYFKHNTVAGNVIASNGGKLTITDSVISNNQAHALFSFNGGPQRLVGGSIIYNEGTLEIIHSTISQNTSIREGPDDGPPSDGNVIANNTFSDGTAGKLTIESSSITSNTVHGSTIYNGSLRGRAGTLNVINSTIKNNKAGQYDGGIKANAGTVTIITACNITDNDAANGGGVAVETGADVKVKDSNIKGNHAITHPDISEQITYN